MYTKLSQRSLHNKFTAFYKIITVRPNSTHTNDKNIVKSSLPDLEIPNTSVPDYIFEEWSDYPNRTAVECAVSGKKFTFEELRRISINLSASFVNKLKLRKGDVVAILSPNIPEYAVCVLGALNVGIIVSTMSPLYTADEISRNVLETNAKAIITISALLPTVLQFSKKLPIIAIKANVADSLPSGVLCFQELMNDLQKSPTVSIDANDVALMLSSSGSTGPPKSVEITHKNVIANVCQINHTGVSEMAKSTLNYQATAVGLLPFFHVGGLIVLLLNTLRRSAKVVTLPKFVPEIYIEMLEKHKPNFLQVVPYIVGFFLNHPGIKKRHFESVESIGSSAAPLSSYDEEKLAEIVGEHVHIFQAYGMTEVSGIVTLNDNNRETYRGAVGEPLRNVLLKFVDDTGKSLGPNKHGEIWIKSPSVMKSYHNKPKATEDTFVDGWLKSGDIGYYNEHNVCFVTDRLKDIIKVKGFQVAPAEIEAIIRDHPDVVEAAVIGIPHNKFGEVPKAYVIAKANAVVKSEDIKHYVSQRVANYKHLLGGVVFVDSLPRAASGKVMRAKLRD